jgi:hypothetical protein
MKKLMQHIDGIDAADLGIIGSRQYALLYAGAARAAIFQRKASEAGTYGGWRWECDSKHPERYPDLPLHAELISAINRI